MQNLVLQNGAIFISDAHENEQRKFFWEFLQSLKNGTLTCSQLFLMGDIFDLLVYEVKATHDLAKPYIILLEELCDKVEIIYLEGNHDFNLSPFFNRVRVFPLQNQPLNLRLESENLKIDEVLCEGGALKKVRNYECKGAENLALSHGDIFLNFPLNFFLKSLRNKPLLRILNVLDFLLKNKISTKIKNNQKQKMLYKKFENSQEFARQRAKKYSQNGALIVEGHYHQNYANLTKEPKYLNLSCFAYERSFFVIQYANKNQI